MLFEILCYTVAIVGTLAFFGSPATPAAEAPTEPQPEPQPEPITEAPQPIEAMPEPQPIAQPAKPATIAPPVVSLVIPTEAPSTDYSTLTSAQLRKECTAAGIRWRNVHGTKHLTKGEMIAALAA